MAQTPKLYQRGRVLAKVESTFGTDAVPTAANDGIVVRDPIFTPDINQLDRNSNLRQSLSPLATSVGRKTARITFQVEVKGSGSVATAPLLGVLLRGCGYNQTQITGEAGTISNAVAGDSNTGTISFAKTTAYTGIYPRTVTLTCTTGGASGTAEVTIASPAVAGLAAIDQTGVVITDSTAIDIGDDGTYTAEVTPTVGTALDIGDTFTFTLTPAGYEYLPVSDNFDSLTLYIYYDGLLHKMTGSVGTGSVESAGGDFALFSFEFTGNYVAPIDAAQPTAKGPEDDIEPKQVELSALTFDGNTADMVASRFGVDLGNQVALREDINQSDAYSGARISGRSPTAGFDPEIVTEAVYAFWNTMSNGTEVEFTAKVGTQTGNIVRFDSPKAQIGNIGYQNRENIRTYDIALTLAGNLGDDELKISFN